jgi:hypothetical protein
MPEQVFSIRLINQEAAAFAERVCVASYHIEILRVGKVPEAAMPIADPVELALELHLTQIRNDETAGPCSFPKPGLSPADKRWLKVYSCNNAP